MLAAALVACGGGARDFDQDPEHQPLIVFAAASLRDVAVDLGREFDSRHGVEVSFNFAGSNTLAQQIDAAPGADVFLSADEQWVDFLDRAGRTVPGTRRGFLSNRLVLIAHRGAEIGVREPADLAVAGYRFLALADPEAVPAGRYARAALERSQVWQAIADHVVPALDVRAALALVESDPEILGIVYRSDAMTSAKVRVLHEFPPSEDTPINYWAVLIAGGGRPELGRRFLDFLGSVEVEAIAAGYGLEAPGLKSDS